MTVWIVLFTSPECATECAKIKAMLLDAIRPDVYRDVHFLEFSEEDYPIFMEDLGIERVPTIAFFKEKTEVENLVQVYDPVQADSIDVNQVRSVLEERFGIQYSSRKPWIWVLILLVIIALVWSKFKK